MIVMKINTLILGLAVLAVAGIATTAYAQVSGTVQADIHAEVTDIQIERGAYADYWYVTVEVTNNGPRALSVVAGTLVVPGGVGWHTADYAVGNMCWSPTGHLVESGDVVLVVGCFAAIQDADPTHPRAIVITGKEWNDVRVLWDKTFAHALDFERDVCEYAADFTTCQTVQNIDHLIHEAEREADSEPMTCEVPVATTTTESNTDQPQLLSAAYHTVFADLVLSFDEDVTLVDGWQDNITIGGVSIGERATNHVEGASGLAWISVDYAVRSDLRDAHSHTITIEAGTFMDADGNTNDRMLVTPSITG